MKLFWTGRLLSYRIISGSWHIGKSLARCQVYRYVGKLWRWFWTTTLNPRNPYGLFTAFRRQVNIFFFMWNVQRNMKYTFVISDNLSRLFLLLVYLIISPTEIYFYCFEKKKENDKWTQYRQVLYRTQENSFYHIFSMSVSGYLVNVIKKREYFYIKRFLTASYYH